MDKQILQNVRSQTPTFLTGTTTSPPLTALVTAQPAVQLGEF